MSNGSRVAQRREKLVDGSRVIRSRECRATMRNLLIFRAEMFVQVCAIELFSMSTFSRGDAPSFESDRRWKIFFQDRWARENEETRKKPVRGAEEYLKIRTRSRRREIERDTRERRWKMRVLRNWQSWENGKSKKETRRKRWQTFESGQSRKSKKDSEGKRLKHRRKLKKRREINVCHVSRMLITW